MSLRESGQEDAAKVLREVTETTPTRARKMRQTFMRAKDQSISPKPYTKEEAFALFLDAKLTKRQYNCLRLGAKTRNADIYPSYQQCTKCLESPKFVRIVYL